MTKYLTLEELYKDFEREDYLLKVKECRRMYCSTDDKEERKEIERESMKYYYRANKRQDKYTYFL